MYLALLVAPTHEVSAVFLYQPGIIYREEGVERITLVERCAEVFLTRRRLMRYFRHLVLVVGYVEAEVDAHILTLACREDASVELQLDTGVVHLTVVDGERRPAGGRVEVGHGEEVATQLAVEVHRTVEPIAKEGKVHTDVPRLCLLPAKLVVRWRVEVAHQAAVVDVRAKAGGEIGRRTGVDVTGQTVAGTQLEGVDPCVGLHELLVLNVPACAHRPQRAATEFRVGAEEVGVVHAVGSEEAVPLVIHIVGREVVRVVAVERVARVEVGQRAAGRIVRAEHARRGVVEEGPIGLQVLVGLRLMAVAVEQIGVCLGVGLAVFETGEHIDGMLAKLMRVLRLGAEGVERARRVVGLEQVSVGHGVVNHVACLLHHA